MPCSSRLVAATPPRLGRVIIRPRPSRHRGTCRGVTVKRALPLSSFPPLPISSSSPPFLSTPVRPDQDLALPRPGKISPTSVLRPSHQHQRLPTSPPKTAPSPGTGGKTDQRYFRERAASRRVGGLRAPRARSPERLAVGRARSLERLAAAAGARRHLPMQLPEADPSVRQGARRRALMGGELIFMDGARGLISIVSR